MIRYRLEFVGEDVPLADQVYRDAAIMVSTVELYGAARHVRVYDAVRLVGRSWLGGLAFGCR